jgi:hypothetical protein
MIAEIIEAQQANPALKHLFKRNAVFDNGLKVKLIESALCVCIDGWLVIPKPLQVRAVMWFHHYLHHAGNLVGKSIWNSTEFCN